MLGLVGKTNAFNSSFLKEHLRRWKLPQKIAPKNLPYDLI